MNSAFEEEHEADDHEGDGEEGHVVCCDSVRLLSPAVVDVLILSSARWCKFVLEWNVSKYLDGLDHWVKGR